MKAKDFEEYSSADLRDMWLKLQCSDIRNLPLKFREYIYYQNSPVGNEMTRTGRVMKLIEHAVVKRFIANEIN